MYDAKILLVDDSEAIIEALRETLERLGCQAENIMTANHPDAALKLFKQHQPAVVFMDMDLDGVPGDKAAAQILKMAPSTKLVIMTGYDRRDPRVRDLISAGAYEFLEKPLRFGRLQQLIELLDSESKGLRRVS